MILNPKFSKLAEVKPEPAPKTPGFMHKFFVVGPPLDTGQIEGRDGTLMDTFLWKMEDQETNQPLGHITSE